MKRMNVIIALFITMIVVFSGCLSTQSDEEEVETQFLKDEAYEFSLSVVISLINGDWHYYDDLNETIYILDGDGIVTKDDWFDIVLENHYPFSVNTTHISIENYHEAYDSRIYTLKECRDSFPGLLDASSGYYTPSNNDYLFVGGDLKEGKDALIWDDFLIFMVTKIGDEWKVNGITG